MSKFRKGQRVTVDGGLLSKQKNAIVHDIRYIKKGDKKVNKRYVIEFTDAEWNLTGKFKTVDKSAMSKVDTIPPKQEKQKKFSPKLYYSSISIATADGNRIVTVCGMVFTTRAVEAEAAPNQSLMLMPKLRKHLCVGFAIKHPEDTPRQSVAKSVAAKRARWNPLSTYMSDNPNEFREDMVMAVLSVKAKYIAENIGDFVTDHGTHETD